MTQLTTNQVNFNGNGGDHGEADRVYLVKSLTVNYSHGKHRFTKEHVIVNYTWFLLLVTVTNDAKKKN